MVLISKILLFNPSSADYYSSLLNVEKLIVIEEEIVQDLEEYVDTLEILLDQCERAIHVWESHHARDIAEQELLLRTPSREFQLIKRNTVDLVLMIEHFLRPGLRGKR
ncbi:hypothetical protein WDU94_003640 [Cyamophila willieti]